MARGDRLEHRKPDKLGQDRGTGSKAQEEDLDRGRGERGAGEPLPEVPQAVGARDQHVGRHAAAGERGRARVVLQQETEREKNDPGGGRASKHGGRLLTGGDPSASPHATKSRPVTVLLSEALISTETKQRTSIEKKRD